MWTRAQLKDKAKAALKANYWKMVLVAGIISLLMGGGGAGGNSGSTDSDSNSNSAFDEIINSGNYEITEEQIQELLNSEFVEYLGKMFVVFIVVFVIALVIGLVIATFVINPLEVGCRRFFVKTLNEKAELKEMVFGFENSYKNVTKVMFFRTLYTLLWSLLFVIPGIIKAYEYYMIPYLLAENPNLTKEQAFALSKQMMMGQKWSTFVLELSFIGWQILSVFTLGILGIFYVGPYSYATYAALYEELSRAYGNPAQNAYANANAYYYER